MSNDTRLPEYIALPIPRYLRSQVAVTKEELRIAWDAIVAPVQQLQLESEENVISDEFHTIMAVMRAVYEAYPDEK